MSNKMTIRELVQAVLVELERLNYSYNSLCGFRAFYRRFIKFSDEQNEVYFTEELGYKFLKSQYKTEINYYKEIMPKSLKNPIRKIRVLGDFQLHGVIIRRIIKKPNYKKPKQFNLELIAYEKECEDNEYSRRGLRTRLQRLYFFIDYLDNRNIKSFNEVTGNVISDYVKTIVKNHEKSISSILTTLRVFLRFLYLNNFTSHDLSLEVPRQKKYYYTPIPSVWKQEDVVHLLESIDRNNPIGKRDYALLLLVTRLGIRVGDIKDMKLSDLNWVTKTIVIQQSKTKSIVTFPILNDIGWALIDYLKNGRPITDSPYVFVRLQAPFEAFGKDANLYNIITKYRKKAGIKLPRNMRHGLHALRHTLASTLLEHGTPIPIISEILGHLNSKSTGIYLHTDIEGLRKCALNPDEVFNYV